MKTAQNMASARRRAGVSLIECVVYIAVFSILLGGGTMAFFFCWDHSRAVIFATDQIESALRAGETWRADVRSATGRMTIEKSATSETLKIPHTGNDIIYRLAAGELHRETTANGMDHVVLAKVKASDMQANTESGVTAWRWELELTPRRLEIRLPLRFTFTAVPPKS